MATALQIPSAEELASTPFYFGQKKVIFLPKQWELCFAPEFEIASVGGFGCLAPDTLILDPVKGILEPIESLTKAGHVLAWSREGPRIAPRPPSFRKGTAMLYRLRTTCGEVIATEGHRFLTSSGWQRLDSLRSGEYLQEFDAFRLQSNLASVPSVHVEDGPHWSQTLRDSQDDCRVHHRLYDGPLHSSEEDGQAFSRQHLDAPRHIHADRRDVGFYDNGHCGYGRLPDKNYSSAGTFRQRPDVATECLNFEALDAQSHRYSQPPSQFPYTSFVLDKDGLQGSDQYLISRNLHACYPYPPKITRIISIEAVGIGEFYDLHVPSLENYWAAGMWHHNSSKTFGGVCRATRLLSWFPGNLGLIGRFASTDLAGTTRHDCLQFWEEANLLDDFVERHKDYKVPTATVKCVDPYTQEILQGKYSEALFLHYDDPSHTHGYHAGFGWIDEANQCTDEARRELISRMRRPGFKGKYSLWYTSNTNKGYDYLYENFLNPEAMEELRRKKPKAYASRRFIHGTTWDNRANLPPDYIENMENSYSEKMVRVLLGASYESFEGQMFEEWDDQVHCINVKSCFPQGIPKEWNRIFALDPGGTGAWAWEFAAIDPTGNVIFYDEIYGPGNRTAPFAERALPKIRPYPNWQAKVIDSENKLAAGELAEYGIYCTNAQKQNKTGDANSSFYRVSGYLHPNPAHVFPEWHPRKGQTGAPRLFVGEKCANIKKEFPQQRWKTDPTSKKLINEPDPKVIKNAIDCVFYVIRELPHPTKLTPGIIADLSPQMSKMGKIMNFERRKREEDRKKELWNIHMGSGRRRHSRFSSFRGGLSG